MNVRTWEKLIYVTNRNKYSKRYTNHINEDIFVETLGRRRTGRLEHQIPTKCKNFIGASRRHTLEWTLT